MIAFNKYNWCIKGSFSINDQASHISLLTRFFSIMFIIVFGNCISSSSNKEVLGIVPTYNLDDKIV